MKRFFITLFFLISAAVYSHAAVSKYTVSGYLGGVKEPLTVFMARGRNVDSTKIVNGKFVFKGETELPFEATLFLRHDRTKPFDLSRDFLPFYVDKGFMSIQGKDSVKTARVVDTPLNKEYQGYRQLFGSLDAEDRALYKEYNEANDEKRKSEDFRKYIEEKSDAIEKKERALNLSYLKAHPDSYISLTKAFPGYMGYSTNVSELGSAYELLSDKLKQTKLGQFYAKRIESLKKTEVGVVAPDFSLPDSTGKEIKLSDFRGKYLLIDFWASWCGPCRHENPNVVKAYNEFKDKNFTILGVSLDSKRENWLNAIAHDGLTWNHVSDLKGWQNAAAELYGVRAIPSNFLIDPNGKIIAKDLRGEELAKTLGEYLH